MNLVKTHAQKLKSNVYYGIKQFSVLIDNQKISLHSFLDLINSNKLSIIAISSHETNDYLVLRIVTNYADKLKNTLVKNNIYFNEQNVMAVEFIHSDDMLKIIDSITAAEIKINYIYPILSNNNNKIGMILNVEDINLASKAVQRIGINTISQNEIDR